MPIFRRTFAQDLDLLEQHLTKEIISQTDYKEYLITLSILTTSLKMNFNSEFKERMQKYTRFDAQSFKDAMICNMDSIGKYMLEIILHQQRNPHLLKEKKLMQTQEDHSNPIQALNIDSLKVELAVIQNTCSEKEDTNSGRLHPAISDCIEHGFKRAFMSLFGQDVDTFTSTMLLNVDQLQKQLDKDEFLRRWIHAAFWWSGNDTDADDADSRPIYDEEPMAEVQLTVECNIFAIRQHHTKSGGSCAKRWRQALAREKPTAHHRGLDAKGLRHG
ncbi:hypothetical protein Tco_1367181 [Tanacetum coccineum]